jgi:UDP:flavonoid glycosyltransferase YjiC (YdhE family)
MARVAVCSAVYLGDVAPFLAVGRRLAERGHDVVAVLPEGFRSTVAGEPFAFHPYALDCSPATMHADPEHERLMRHPFRNMNRLGGYWIDKAFADDVEGAEASLRAGFAGADVVVTHPTFGMASIPVARSMGIPVVAGQLFPMMIPTAAWTPPIGARNPRLPAPLSRAVWWVLRRGSGLAMGDRATNRLRRRLGQPAIHGAAGFTWLEADRTVILASRHYYGEGAADWPPHAWGGFAAWEGPPGQELDADLEAFLADGPPPVLVTLGTSAATGSADRFRLLRDGLAAVGHRSVLLVGSSVDVGALAGQPGVVPFAPMPLVLPHCSAAVVSGALGGMAAAMRAGVPMVIHPQLFDQVWNGRRVEQLGIGLMARKPSQVAGAVQRVLADPGYAARAAALAAALAEEDGADACADAVEALL